MKVLLVDDEPIILKGLQCLIDWSEYGYEICGTSTSAVRALELTSDLKPDLVITDLVMPDLNGLELIQRLTEKHETCKIVILSGHGEFQYAQKALELGVFDYLLKPVSREKLIECIGKVKKSIEEELVQKSYIDEINQKLKDSFPLLRDKFLSDVLKGRLKSEEEILKMSDYLKIPFEGTQYLVLAMEIEWDDIKLRFDGGDDEYLLQFAIHNIVSEVLGKSFLNRTFWDGMMIYSILIFQGRTISTENMFDILSELNDILKQYISVKLTIGVGKKYSSVADIYKSAKEAKEALKNKFLMGKEAIIFAGHALNLAERKVNYSLEEEKRIIDTIKYGHDVNPQDLANQLIESFINGCGSNQSQVYECCFEFCVQLKRNLAAAEFETTGINDLWKITECKTADELKEWLTDIISRVYEILCDQRQRREYDVTEQVKEYIKNNYAKEITLKSMADLVYMSPTYFSALFKKKTNENFQEYLTKVRMEAARELLRDSTHKTYEVSYMVGYNNARYFSDVFKKYYGVTPSEYKEAIK